MIPGPDLFVTEKFHNKNKVNFEWMKFVYIGIKFYNEVPIKNSKGKSYSNKTVN